MIDKLTGTAGSKIDNTNEVSRILSARVLCENVYNLYQGQIVYIGAANGRAVVNVKCNPSEVLRYGNLTELNCRKGYYAESGAQLGVADGYVTFEYCTAWKGNSNFVVRVNGETFYKQDPTEVLNGKYAIRKDGAQEEGYVFKRDLRRFTSDEQYELFGANILDKYDQAKSKQKWSTKKSREVIAQLTANRPINYVEEDDEGQG